MKQVNTLREYLDDSERVSPAEREIIELEKELILKAVEARQAKGMSQRDLAKASGIKQPAIARIEKMRSSPQVDTVIKMLVPLGYTLKVVPLDQRP